MKLKLLNYALMIVVAQACSRRLPAAAEVASADPAASLVELAKSSAPNISKIKTDYLQLQWLRLTGKAPLPQRATESDEERMYRFEDKAPSKPLSEEEIANLSKWLDASPKMREHFLLAINAREDDLPNCARVAMKLREAFPKDYEAFENLMLAYATVWDDETLPNAVNKQHIPEYRHAPYKHCTLEESFGWFVKNQQKLCPWFKQTPWRLLTFVATDNMENTEREWVVSKYAFKPTLGTTYSEIVYDNDKLVDMKGKLAGKEYTLANLKQYGGVCRDQGYFAREVCRAYGMPAYLASGQSNSEGLHAWVGWIIRDAQGFKLMNHGRYEYDKYFTANIIDPKSGKMILDYLVGIEAKALSDEKGYDDADLLYRVFEEVKAELPAKQQVDLLINALKKNAFHRAAWLEVGDATANGALSQASAAGQWEYLNKNFKEFPDFTYSMLGKFSKVFKTPLEKYNFYETSSKIFFGLKRQDLVANLRLDEIKMLTAEERKDLAAQAAVAATTECAGEGANGAELAKRAVELLREQKKPQLAIAPLQLALSKMLKVRAQKVNPHWLSMSELLRDIYKETGDMKNADRIQSDISRAK
jgi:hypothetical protein